jgi:hypothetical protein
MELEMVELKAVTKTLAWGKLVKSWATGINYFDKTKPAPAIPKTLAEFKDQCTARGIAVNLPSYITSLNVVQLEKSALNVHLPEKSLVLEAETQLTAPGGTYPIPPFYDDFYGTQLEVADDKKLDLQACRIGDYSIGMCA